MAQVNTDYKKTQDQRAEDGRQKGEESRGGRRVHRQGGLGPRLRRAGINAGELPLGVFGIDG